MKAVNYYRLLGRLLAALCFASSPLQADDSDSQRYIIMMKDGTIAEGLQTSSSGESMNEIVQRLMSGVRQNQLEADSQQGILRSLSASQNINKHNHIYERVFKGFSANLTEDGAEYLRQQPEVESVQPDVEFELFEIQNSPPSWGLDRIDQRSNQYDNAYEYYTTGTNVHMYVIDTGLDRGHPEFTGRAHRGYDFFNNDRLAEDDMGHGTHVAGTAAGTVVGVAKRVNIHPLKVFGIATPDRPRDRTWGQTIIAALEHVLRENRSPAVVNMSLGGRVQRGIEPFETAVKRVVEAGITVVVGAGNNSINACDYTPARIPEVITVGASNQQDQRAMFTISQGSNQGPCIDVVAPGLQIHSSMPRNAQNLTNCDRDLDGDGYGLCSGTSMATPHVAGIAAMYLQSNRTASPDQVKSAIISGSTKMDIPGFNAATVNRMAYNQVNNVRITQPEIVATAYVDSHRMACAWYYNNTVSCGMTRDLDSKRRSYRYSLAPGYTPEDVVDIAWINTHNMACAFYTDGRVSCGTTFDLDDRRTPYRYTLPAGKTPDNIVGIAYQNERRATCAWYDDRTLSCGTTRNLERISGLRGYSLPRDYSAMAIDGIGWVEHRNAACVWYNNGKVSCGSENDLDSWRLPQDFKRLE
jgi:subtilisin family serine protease